MSNSMRIRFMKIHKNAKIPERSHKYDAGADIFSTESVSIEPGEDVMIPTGIVCDVPEGWVMIMKEKSGRAINDKLCIGASVIDCGYRGQLFAHLFNSGKDVVYIDSGEKVAQILFFPVWSGKFLEVKELEETERNINGFGSTGLL